MIGSKSEFVEEEELLSADPTRGRLFAGEEVMVLAVVEQCMQRCAK